MSNLRSAFMQGAVQQQAIGVVPYKNPRTPDGLLFGQQYFLRKLSVWESDQYQAENAMLRAESVGKEKMRTTAEFNSSNIRCRLIVLALCDEKGKLIFPGAGDAATVGQTLDAATADDIYQAALKHNDMDQDAQAVTEKNSTTPIAGSGTSSPGSSDAPASSNSNAA